MRVPMYHFIRNSFVATYAGEWLQELFYPRTWKKLVTQCIQKRSELSVHYIAALVWKIVIRYIVIEIYRDISRYIEIYCDIVIRYMDFKYNNK